MCELLGMSANVPTDICFSLTGLIERGGVVGPHEDGWGICFYEGKAVRVFKDTKSSSKSKIARFVKEYPIKSHIVISHIRQANCGETSLENTHPFIREFWGREWSYAHNGQLKDFKRLELGYFNPVGRTDSEYIFCYILDQVFKNFKTPPKDDEELWIFLADLCKSIKPNGVLNLLFSDSKYLYCFCTTKLTYLTRRAPFKKARLKDLDVTIDFEKETTDKDVVSVIATEPLTQDEKWNPLDEGTFCVFKEGILLKKIL